MKKPMWELLRKMTPEESDELFTGTLSPTCINEVYNEITGLALWLQNFAIVAERRGCHDLLARTVNFVEAQLEEYEKVKELMEEFENSNNWIEPIMRFYKHDILCRFKELMKSDNMKLVKIKEESR
jgi:hypothetical protein